MRFEQYFKNLRGKFIHTDVSDIQGILAIQMNIKGNAEQSGTFYIEIKNGVLSIEPYEYNDRNVAISISQKNFDKIISGRLDPVVAFTTGLLKAEGDVGKALELKRFIKK